MISQFCIAWRKGQRRVWGSPSNTHNDLNVIVYQFSMKYVDDFYSLFVGVCLMNQN
jgi:hypothetical protein